jgi:hypothetical protein
MTNLQALYEAVRTLNDEERDQLRQYLDHLEQQPASASPLPPRVLGLNVGAMTISDDFTDPLPDDFWLGET